VLARRFAPAGDPSGVVAGCIKRVSLVITGPDIASLIEPPDKNGKPGTAEGEALTTWHVRPYRVPDTPGLLTLYTEVFGRARTEEEFRWKLLSLESPVDTVWVAATAERIVGQHAGIPTWMKLGDSQVFAMQAVEAITHSAHRREGMLTKLGGGLYEHWRDRGVPLVIGLPHAGWGSRATALGYRQFLALKWMSRPLRPLAMLAAKLKPVHDAAESISTRLGPLEELEQAGRTIVQQQVAGRKFDELWGRVAPAYENCVVRDAAWVQWRYLDVPDRAFVVLLAERGGAPAGYIAYRLVNTGGRLIGRVADIFSHPDDLETVHALVESAVTHMRRHGADSVATLVASGSSLYARLRRLGFVFARGEYEASCIPFSQLVGLERMNDPAKWLMTGGDFDVV
jgi:hypothetical protein